MKQLKRLCKVPANSLLESVIALTIISVCLYIAIMVYSAVFAPNTSMKFYSSQNKIQAAFFDMQIGLDSLKEKYDNENWSIEEEFTEGSKKIIIKYSDSITEYPEKVFYVP
ncbi:hypothetical protein [Flavobacterium sp. C4GT6]|uniref:hypothetical protein n=1 Tax=Flavobacterium sp. C4GT6 TaxID=3103818 RepID=UPI002ED68E08